METLIIINEAVKRLENEFFYLPPTHYWLGDSDSFIGGIFNCTKREIEYLSIRGFESLDDYARFRGFEDFEELKEYEGRDNEIVQDMEQTIKRAIEDEGEYLTEIGRYIDRDRDRDIQSPCDDMHNFALKFEAENGIGTTMLSVSLYDRQEALDKLKNYPDSETSIRLAKIILKTT